MIIEAEKNKMSKLIRKIALPIVSGIAMSLLPIYALAANGFYLTGYGNESMLMGGADVAVARDAFAANNNAAGMTQLKGQAFDFSYPF